ncbi:MAG: GatB/YqeY domain-containing protein [Alphaproteobacteria bacterium]|nr:GatB/YqeY domain-containing protein [Alphaproteobacteria bacterium]
MLRDEIQNALKNAMKNKDTKTVSAARLIVAGIKNKDVDARAKGEKEASEADILSLMQTMIKQRKESFRIYEEAKRVDLAEKEQSEIEVIQSFMPKQMSDAEVETAIKGIIAATGASSAKDMGKVMAELKAKYSGKVDFSTVSAKVKALLS